MSRKTKTTATNEEAKPALVPKLRLPEFRKADGWKIGKIDDLVDTVTPPKKLPTSNYAATGAFPIIDQSQNDICGWTDDNDALIQEDLPLIFFGDHTCILKLIDRPFAQGADGIKILKSRSKIGTSFLYQFLSYRPVVTEEYKRHYSILKEKLVAFPDFKTGEQQKIASCLSSVDELMAAQARKVDALKTHKKGLMQQLFPREGETQPHLRFPEFQNAGVWEVGTLVDACRMQAGKFVAAADIKEQNAGDLFLCFGGNGLRGFTATHTHDGVYPLIGRQGALCGNVKLATCRFHATEHAVVATPNRGVEVVWLYYLLDLLNLYRFATGQAQPGLSVDVLEKVPVTIPNNEREQHRIATCLSSLDALITAETQKHEALKTHKKGLMQQLFPAPTAHDHTSEGQRPGFPSPEEVDA